MRSAAAALLLLLVAACGAASSPPIAPVPPAPSGGPAPAAHHDASAPDCAGVLPTYAGEVHLVLERSCLSCHAGDGPAADEHDFSREATLRAQRARLLDVVSARAMPPAGRPGLSDSDARTLLRWAACGAP